MTKLARKEKNKILASKFYGSSPEPEYNPLAFGKIALCEALNYYSMSAKHEHMKEWAREYCVANYPQAVEAVTAAKKTRFTTFGALARMHARGFELDQSVMDRLHIFLDSLNVASNETVELDEEGMPIFKESTEAASPRATRKVVYINAALRNLDDNQDLAIAGESYRINMLEGDVGPVIAKCEQELALLEEEQEAYTRPIRKALKRLYTDTLAAARVARVAVKQEKLKRVSKRAVPPQKQVEKVQFKRDQDIETGLKSMNPTAALGRTKMYVFDVARRRLYCYIGTAAGFMFKGTTLYNVDLAKSSWKKVRKPERFFKAMGSMSVSQLNKGYAAINGKEIPLNASRFNENCIIVEVTNY